MNANQANNTKSNKQLLNEYGHYREMIQVCRYQAKSYPPEDEMKLIEQEILSRMNQPELVKIQVK